MIGLNPMTGRCLQNLLVGVTRMRGRGGRKCDKSRMRLASIPDIKPHDEPLLAEPIGGCDKNERGGRKEV